MGAMIFAIESFLTNTLGAHFGVIICSMIPIIELRGAIPLGMGLELQWWQSYLYAVIGNMIPVPFILLFITALLKWMRRCRIRLFNKIAAWLDRKIEKHKGTIEKYSYWGVLIFVGLPIPGTGAWTGSLIASVLGLEPKKSFLAAFGGVVMATAIMTVVSYGLKAAF